MLVSSAQHVLGRRMRLMLLLINRFDILLLFQVGPGGLSHRHRVHLLSERWLRLRQLEVDLAAVHWQLRHIEGGALRINVLGERLNILLLDGQVFPDRHRRLLWALWESSGVPCRRCLGVRNIVNGTKTWPLNCDRKYVFVLFVHERCGHHLRQELPSILDRGLESPGHSTPLVLKGVMVVLGVDGSLKSYVLSVPFWVVY